MHPAFITARKINALLFAATLWLGGCAAAPQGAVRPQRPAALATPKAGGLLGRPVYAGDFPDPFILPVGGEYFSYATNSDGANIPALKLSADFSQAVVLGDVLPDLPEWAARNRSLTWAPAVLPSNGQYVLYYTARYTQMGLQCISRAVSSTPQGPFIDDSPRPLVCQFNLGGSIDPSPFVDMDGKAYLLWKNDGNSSNKRVGLWIQPLSADGLALVDEPRELLRMDQDWEQPLIEAPAMVLHAGRYYLFYSAGWWESAGYVIHYAVGDTPYGPFTKRAGPPWFSSCGDALGPGGADFFTGPGGQLWMAYHAWTAPNVGYPAGKRTLHITPIRFSGTEPIPDFTVQDPYSYPYPYP